MRGQGWGVVGWGVVGKISKGVVLKLTEFKYCPILQHTSLDNILKVII